MLSLLGPSPAWRDDRALHSLPNTLPGWTVAFLALQGDWVARERLAALLWPDVAMAEALHNLRMDLHRVRPLLAEWGVESALEAERRRVRLVLPTDAAALQRAIDDASAPLDRAPGVLLGSFVFEGFPALREWAELERAAQAGRWRDAMLARLANKAPADTVGLAQALLEADPLDDDAMQHLLRSLQALGRWGDAQRHYAAYRERLQRELGVEPVPALQVFAAGPSAAAPLRPDAGAFIGRSLELSELSRRLTTEPARLLTLVGPGGVGKSRLARQALTRVEGPVTWIDLQDLDSIDAVAARLASRLGVDLRDGAEAATRIGRALGGAAHLVTLDNAEHLVPELGVFAAHCLAAAPGLTLLITSRRPLGAEGESVLALDGLALPDEDSRDAEAAGAFDAVRLFETRALVANPGFQLAPQVDAVIEIVERVGGMPLAIELAAAWLRLLPPQAIANELRRSLEALERDPTAEGLPARPEHASLRAVLERSFNLLSPVEREAIVALAVFAGGFTAAAAHGVAGVRLPLLAALADKSLLRADATGRFGLHAVVAGAMEARAAEDPDTLRARRDRHVEHVAALLHRLLAEHGNDDRAIARAMDEELSNARRAWQHALATGRWDRVQRMVPAWRRYFEAKGRYREACAHFRAVLAQANASASGSLGLAHVRAALGHFLVRSNDPEQARALVAEALATAEAEADTMLVRVCVSTLGGCALALARFDEARGWFERVKQLNVEADDRRGLAAASNSLGLVHSYLGRFEDALQHCADAMNAYRSLGNDLGVARSMMNMAQIHAFREDWRETRGAAQAALRHASQHELPAIAAMAEFWLGLASLELGDFEPARKHLERSRERCRAEGQTVFEFKADYHLLQCACRQGRGDPGALLAAARTASERGWVEDLLYLGIFVAEALRDQGQPREAQVLLQAVLSAPDDDSDAGIRARARRALASLPPEQTPEAAAPLGWDAAAAGLATCDTLSELTERLRKTAA